MMPDDAEQLAIKLMNDWGLIAKGWTFDFDLPCKRFGMCNYRRKRITLSKLLVCLNDEPEVTETILHEIAHAICGPHHGHNNYWRKIALAVGCKPRACYGEEVKQHYGK
jgi:predicted SprT family Zn-dependent metalloprotease